MRRSPQLGAQASRRGGRLAYRVLYPLSQLACETARASPCPLAFPAEQLHALRLARRERLEGTSVRVGRYQQYWKEALRRSPLALLYYGGVCVHGVLRRLSTPEVLSEMVTVLCTFTYLCDKSQEAHPHACGRARARAPGPPRGPRGRARGGRSEARTPRTALSQVVDLLVRILLYVRRRTALYSIPYCIKSRQ